MLSNPKYSVFNYKFPGSFANQEEVYTDVKLPYHVEGKGRKILFVLDYLPSEDKRSGRLLSGQTYDLLKNICIVSKSVYLKDNFEKFSWMACTFNAFRTAGKSHEFQAQAKEAFAERVKALILRYKPDVVVSFGAAPSVHLIPKKITLSNGRLANWYGVPVKTKITYKKDSHACVLVPTLSLNTIINGTATEASMIGYVARNLANALNGKLLYALDSERLDKHKSVLIDTIKKFDKLLDMLREQPYICGDTETANLNKVTNTLLTIQFAKCQDYGYIIPYRHKDTPFVAKELNYIKNRLRNFFEGDNKNEYHIYANAQFDLNVLRTELGARCMVNRVWDIFAGEFCFHPDTFVLTETGFIKISVLVDLKDPPKVWSYNFESRTVELQDIIGSSSHSSDEDMYEIEYEGGAIRVTENHKVWSSTRNKYVEAKDIQPNEDIVVLV